MISPTSKMLFIITNLHEIEIGNLTVCVTCVWAGVDSVWEQENADARKMLENAAESHTSGARFVGTLLTLRLACLRLYFLLVE